jgi:hypothetical protein
MINKRFEGWVKDAVGERAHLDLKQTDPYRRAMKTFDETIKPGFRGVDDEVVYISFPMASIADNPSKGIKGNTMTLKP